MDGGRRRERSGGSRSLLIKGERLPAEVVEEEEVVVGAKNRARERERETGRRDRGEGREGGGAGATI